MTIEIEEKIHISHDADIVSARQIGKELATRAGFSGSDLTLIATAISELARNIVVYAKSGEITLLVTNQNGNNGIIIVAEDKGPGIPNIDQAMQDGFSTGNSLGLGLPGAKRFADEFYITSTVGSGTTVTLKKWVSH